MQWKFWDEVGVRASQRVKINIENIRPAPIRHEKLPEALVERIKEFHKVLAEVDVAPLEKVIDNFRGDLHPDREVAIWEGIAEKYQTRVKSSWGIHKKKELYGKLLRQSMDENPLVVGFRPPQDER